MKKTILALAALALLAGCGVDPDSAKKALRAFSPSHSLSAGCIASGQINYVTFELEYQTI